MPINATCTIQRCNFSTIECINSLPFNCYHLISSPKTFSICILNYPPLAFFSFISLVLVILACQTPLAQSLYCCRVKF